MSAVGLVVLAAGASARMGTPKQLLRYQGQSLIQRVVEIAVNSVCQPIIVVLGANAEQIQPELAGFNVQVIRNLYWAEGISTSIRAGIAALTAKNPRIEAVVVCVCDQPLISTQLINQLVEHYQRSQPCIVASAYADVLGVPALFHHTLFSALTTLSGDVGARKIIQQHAQTALQISCPQGVFDIDTPADYATLAKINFLH